MLQAGGRRKMIWEAHPTMGSSRRVIIKVHYYFPGWLAAARDGECAHCASCLPAAIRQIEWGNCLLLLLLLLAAVTNEILNCYPFKDSHCLTNWQSCEYKSCCHCTLWCFIYGGNYGRLAKGNSSQQWVNHLFAAVTNRILNCHPFKKSHCFTNWPKDARTKAVSCSHSTLMLHIWCELR